MRTWAEMVGIGPAPASPEALRAYARTLRLEARLFRLAGGSVTASEWSGFTPLERRAFVAAAIPEEVEAAPSGPLLPEGVDVLAAGGAPDLVAQLVEVT